MKKYLLILFISFLLNSCNSKEKWFYEKALPDTAEDVHVWHQNDGFLPDYTYYLKARISRQEFFNYIDSLEMNLHTDTSNYTDDTLWIQTSGAFNDTIKSWWNDTRTDSMYVWQNGHEWNTARYIDGYLYLLAIEH